jgi:DNA-binding IclR family transcriptional regulator
MVEDGLGEEASAPTGAIDRTLAVLTAMAEARQPIGISEIARRLNLPKSVVHYHVSALVRNHYAAVSPDRRYCLGPGAVRLAAEGQARRDLGDQALPHLRSLREQTAETVTLSQLVGRERVYLETLPSMQGDPEAIEPGTSMPLDVGASGRVMLAFLPEPVRESVLAERLERLSTSRAPDAFWMREELARVRSAGVACSRGERAAGRACLAAPLFDGRGVLGAIAVCGPEERFLPAAVDRWSSVVRAIAMRLSWELAESERGQAENGSLEGPSAAVGMGSSAAM